jgi:mono/diheme cytochrome c family protein
MMRQKNKPILRALTGIVVVAAIVAFFIVWRPSVALESSAPNSSPAEITRGAQLAALGNCITCHTKADGTSFAGGRPIETPFGTIYSTNVTPDRDTGIGGWSAFAFQRAMKDGVSRDGHHLYPAFPYDHMAKMSDEDIAAVYAFIMSRRSVKASPPPNNLPFPFNQRPLIAGWKQLFLDRGVTPTNAAKSADWNRGAYLVEGLGHCGACHTPRNALGAEKRDQAYAGGEADGWIAPALNAASPAAIPWDADRLSDYLRKGFEPLHGVAAGPMAEVVTNLRTVPDRDVRAVATYVADIAGASASRQTDAQNVLARVEGKAPAPAASGPGADIYAAACSQCHGELGRTPAIAAVNLSLSSTLRNPRADNAIRIVRDGIQPADDGAGPIMPGFGAVLSDDQLESLMTFLRAHFAERPPWNDIRQSIVKTGQTTAARSAP